MTGPALSATAKTVLAAMNARPVSNRSRDVRHRVGTLSRRQYAAGIRELRALGLVQ